MHLSEYIPPRVKCLLVDDLDDNLLALSALLAQHDVEILTARSGIEALELLLIHDVALALLDVQMPEMDGFELAELIRGTARTRDVPLIFVTAGARDQPRQFKGYDTGAVDFLYKPINPHILKSKAGVFFQLYRQKQQLAHELQQRTETLRLNEMFMAVLGHDLRNPLSAIVTSAYVLKRIGGNEVVLSTAARILSSGKRMSRMIEDMLDLARARLAGGIVIKRETTDLSLLLGHIIQEHDDASETPRISVHLSGDLTGEWDADRLEQVVSNLIGNAFQHGQSGTTVDIVADGTLADLVVLSVTNAGQIKSELLPHIFDPFRGEPRDTGRDEGLGLGLYIVQQIVHAHNGSIGVQCALEFKTCFEIKLPRNAVTSIRL